MIKVESLAEETGGADKIFMVVMSPPGGGKTVFSCGSQKRKTTVIDVDKSLKSALCWDGDALWKSGDTVNGIPPTNINNVQKITVNNADELAQAVDHVLKHHNNRDDIVVIDSVTQAQRLVQKMICEKRKILTPDKPAYGAIFETFDRIFDNLKLLKCHVVLTAHEIERSEEENGPVTIRPDFVGMMKRHYSRNIDLTARYVTVTVPRQVEDPITKTVTIVNETARALQFRFDGKAEVKDRSNVMDWERPQIDHVFDKYLAQMKKRTEEARVQLGQTQ